MTSNDFLIFDNNIYGLDNFGQNIILSISITIILILGIERIGCYVIRALKLSYSNSSYMNFVLGISILSIILSWLLLIGQFNTIFSKFLAYILCFLGVINVLNFTCNIILRKYIKIQLNNLLIIIIILLLIILAILPISDTDVLDYHMGVAIEMLNTHSYVYAPYWFHSRLAGNGEGLIAFGLSIDAIQFGPLIQLCGLFTISNIIWNKYKNVTYQIFILTAPVIVIWAISAKPVLLPISLIVTSLVIFIEIRLGNIDKKDCFKLTIIASLLLITSLTFRINYVSSVIIVFTYGLYSLKSIINWRLNNSILYLIIFSIIAIVILSPQYIWKYNYYSTNFFELIFNPFPGNWPGYDKFLNTLKEYKDSKYVFPIFLIIPDRIGTISTIFGLGFILLINKLKNQYQKELIILFIFDIIFVFLFIQNSSRFFIQSYIFLLIIYSFFKMDVSNIIKKLALVQMLFFIALVTFFLLRNFIAIFDSNFKYNYLSINALNYNEIEWVNNIIDKNQIIISELRPISLYKSKAISNDWMSYVDKNEDKEIYKNFIRNLNPKFIVKKSDSNGDLILENNQEIYAGPFESSFSTRNPFNSGKKYRVWIIRKIYD